MGLARCDIHENDQDLYARFMGGLNCDIQDILDYKEWTRFSQLYHLALKAEREVQGCQHSFKGNSSKPFSPRSTSEKEKTSTLVPQVPEVSKPVLQAPPTKKTSPLSPSSSGSANIICHRYKGMGHVMRDCPSMHAYIATGDGGYKSASNVEDEYRVAANLYAEEKAAGENGETIDSNTMTSHLRSILVQRALSAQPVPSNNAIICSVSSSWSATVLYLLLLMAGVATIWSVQIRSRCLA